MSGRVKKRTRQVLKRSKRSKAEGETDGRRNELHLPTCLMNVPAGGMQRRVKGSGSPGRGGMAGRQRSGKERLYGCRDTCCASKRQVAGRREGGRTVLGSQYPRIRTSTTRRVASLVLPSLHPAQSGGRRRWRMDDAGETAACNWRFQAQKLLFVFISRHDRTMSVRNACVLVPTEKKAPPFDPVLLPLLTTSSTCANNIDCIYHFTVHVLGQTKHIDRFYA